MDTARLEADRLADEIRAPLIPLLGLVTRLERQLDAEQDRAIALAGQVSALQADLEAEQAEIARLGGDEISRRFAHIDELVKRKHIGASAGEQLKNEAVQAHRGSGVAEP
jgi:hypothetical protein